MLKHVFLRGLWPPYCSPSYLVYFLMAFATIGEFSIAWPSCHSVISSMRVYWSWHAQHIARSWDKGSPFRSSTITKVTFQSSCNSYFHLFNRHLFTYDYMNHVTERCFSRQILTDTVCGWQSLTVPTVDFELRSNVPILGVSICTQEEKYH